jgi:hypothetical protein
LPEVQEICLAEQEISTCPNSGPVEMFCRPIPNTIRSKTDIITAWRCRIVKYNIEYKRNEPFVHLLVIPSEFIPIYRKFKPEILSAGSYALPKFLTGKKARLVIVAI